MPVGKVAYLSLSPGAGPEALSEFLPFSGLGPTSVSSSLQVLLLWVLLPKPLLPALSDFMAQECVSSTSDNGYSKQIKATEAGCDFIT